MVNVRSIRLKFHRGLEERRKLAASMDKWKGYEFIDSPYMSESDELSADEKENGWVTISDSRGQMAYVMGSVVLGVISGLTLMLDYLLWENHFGPWYLVPVLGLVGAVSMTGLFALRWAYGRRKVSRCVLSHDRLEFMGERYDWSQIIGLAAYEDCRDGRGKVTLVISFFESDDVELSLVLSKKKLRKLMNASRFFLELHDFD